MSFRYNKSDEELTLKKVTMKIHKGQKIAFVGPSGCGKSTIFNILQRFYNYRGQILIDGVKLNDYDVHHVRSFFAAVTQEPSLFSGTLIENIRYNS